MCSTVATANANVLLCKCRFYDANFTIIIMHKMRTKMPRVVAT